ncbi:hypothetical protein EDD16DRAFT_1528722, partial [Pisolithus croceorrhizus]
FAGGLLHNPLVEGEYQQQGAGGGELVEGTQNIAYAFPPCLAGLQREEVEGTHEQGEQQDAWDKVQWEVDDGVEEVTWQTWILSHRERRMILKYHCWLALLGYNLLMKVYTPAVSGEDLEEVVQQLVGNDVEGESLELASSIMCSLRGSRRSSPGVMWRSEIHQKFMGKVTYMKDEECRLVQRWERAKGRGGGIQVQGEGPNPSPGGESPIQVQGESPGGKSRGKVQIQVQGGKVQSKSRGKVQGEQPMHKVDCASLSVTDPTLLELNV